MSRLAAGAVLADGRYELQRPLGSGGMAMVWLAQDERLGRLVAVKVIADVLAADPDYVRRFEREARTAARLSHRNLVDVYDFALDDGRPILVMEYIAGGSLAERLKGEGGAVPPPRQLAHDLLDALADIHEAGIVHRDVKPGNVLLGDDGRARLTDFGIAHPEDATRLTVTGNVLGTLRYLAPEVTEGKPATARSDLYSLGVLLRESGAETADPPLPALVESLVKADPRERPASARAALELLDAEQKPTPTRVRSEPTAATRVIPARSHRRPLGLAAVLVAIALVVGVIIVAGGGDDGDGTKPQTTPLPPAGASLQRQLDALDQSVRDAGR